MKSTSKTDNIAFKDAYKRLNASQREAVDTIEGPVMVIAGPGTGKTQILTLRIANILTKTDTAPSSILALTFTESGAKAMRERLRQYIGSTAYQVPIFTFHGFAQKLIADYPDAYERVIGGRPINDLEKIKNIETIINGGQIKLLRPLGNPDYYVSHVLRIIGDLKQEYITPDRLAELITKQEKALLEIEQFHQKGAHKGKERSEYTTFKKNIAKNQELLLIYREYEALLTEQRFYDFNDMILETVKALSTNEDMLRDLQENYQYILADEHQDVNGAQNKILELLAAFHDNPNLFVVGDEKQAIYRFQGASLENFLYFTEQYPNTKVISLTKNYRSGQNILDGAHSLIKVEDGPLKDLRLPLKAEVVPKATVSKHSFGHEAVENSWLVDMVKEKISSGIAENEIAVIVRTNREVEEVSTLLRKQGVAVTATADGDILKHPITTTVLSLIKAVTDITDLQALFTILHGPYWGIDTDDLVKLLTAQSYDRSLHQLITDEQILADIKIKNPDSILQVNKTLEKTRQLEVTELPHQVLQFLLQESGLLNYLVKNDPVSGTRVVRRIYDEIESLVLRDGLTKLTEINNAFATRISYNLPLNAPYILTDNKAVQVMTAHKSKGLEFRVVFLPHVTDNNWGASNKKQYFAIPFNQTVVENKHELIEDERRLLYVAMTRAKEYLFISRAAVNNAGRELSESRLLSDLDDDVIEQFDQSEETESFDPIAELQTSESAVEVNIKLLTQLLQERGFSATSLNNYLRSPWDYFYRNILRIPEIQPPTMQFGTVVHNTLEYLVKSYSLEGKLGNINIVKKKLEQELGRLPITKTEYSRQLEKGLETMVIYLEHLTKTLPSRSNPEMKFRVLLPTGIPELPEIPLTGKLDRLDFDDVGFVTRVVDYKTGKAKSRKVIEGETKDSNGDYKRQLVFYALLLQLYGDEKYLCKTGVLSFVEPDTKGHIREEEFQITDAEIESLRLDIVNAAKEIISGEFLKKPCDPEKSDYCDLVHYLHESK